MKFIKPKIFLLWVVVIGFCSMIWLSVPGGTSVALAVVNLSEQLEHAGGQAGAGYGEYVDPRIIVSNIVRLLLTLVATIIFCLMVYAGYQWMTAGGNDEQITTAKQTIFNSTIGLIIILSAYGITILVTNLALGRALGGVSSFGISW